MGAGESKQAGDNVPGIVTVSSRPSPHGSGRGAAAAAAGAGADADTLLAHLHALRSLVPDIHSRLGRADPAAGAVWRDVESAKQLGADTRELNAALADLLGAYREWHAQARRGAQGAEGGGGIAE
jgi:hypothetical protein